MKLTKQELDIIKWANKRIDECNKNGHTRVFLEIFGMYKLLIKMYNYINKPTEETNDIDERQLNLFEDTNADL